MPGVASAALVGVGGALGALLRHAVSERVGGDEFPVGVIAVNVLGSFLLGLVAFSGASDRAALFVGTGICGAFTTFSSFSVATVGLWEDGRRTAAVANAAGTLAAAGVAVGAAWVAVGAW